MRQIAFAVALACAGTAHAGVVYNWETVDPLGNPTVLTGQMEVTNDAYASGRIDHEYRPSCPIYVCADNWPSGPSVDLSDPDSPVVTFSFSADGYEHEAFSVNYRLGTGFMFDSHDYFVGLILGDTITTLLPGEYGYHGFISAGTGERGVGMVFGSDLWKIVGYGSDRARPCYDPSNPDGNSQCEGVTGRWVLDASTVPDVAQVPLPGTLALLGIGAVVATARRRKAG